MSQPLKQPPPVTHGNITAGGCALVVVGLLILIPSGLCTASMGISSLVSMFTLSGGITAAISGLVMTLILGGPFIVAGIFLVRAGLRSRKPE